MGVGCVGFETFSGGKSADDGFSGFAFEAGDLDVEFLDVVAGHEADGGEEIADGATNALRDVFAFVSEGFHEFVVFLFAEFDEAVDVLSDGFVSRGGQFFRSFGLFAGDVLKEVFDPALGGCDEAEAQHRGAIEFSCHGWCSFRSVPGRIRKPGEIEFSIRSECCVLSSH